MSSYRIIEKKGVYTTLIKCGKKCSKLSSLEHDKNKLCKVCSVDKSEYIPRYIVQKCVAFNKKFLSCRWDIAPQYLKEFTNLEEAQKYKRDLELDEGIVIE